MKRRLLWFWPLFLAIPLAIGVVIRTNLSATLQPTGFRWLALTLFSYTLYYFVLSWPVWLVRISQVRRTVISSADSSDSRRQRGTGLGLYLTRMLVERMRGDIRFETAPDQGTTFFVRLPRIPAPPESR